MNLINREKLIRYRTCFTLIAYSSVIARSRIGIKLDVKMLILIFIVYGVFNLHLGLSFFWTTPGGGRVDFALLNLKPKACTLVLSDSFVSLDDLIAWLLTLLLLGPGCIPTSKIQYLSNSIDQYMEYWKIKELLWWYQNFLNP